jgi:FtsZ-binding cell division protein ZapB
MRGKASTNFQFPLFPEKLDVWESLDNQIQQKVESLIARLLAMHIEQSVSEPNELPNTKENQS